MGCIRGERWFVKFDSLDGSGLSGKEVFRVWMGVHPGERWFAKLYPLAGSGLRSVRGSKYSA